MNFTSAFSAPPQVRVTNRVTPLRLVVALTLIAVAVRLVGITHRPLWLDESYSAWFSARSWTELWTVVPTYETHPPFYYSLLKLWRTAFGASAFALRFPSMLLGVATVPIVLEAARELERLRPTGRPMLFAGLAGFLAACGPTLVEHGQEARPYALMAFAYAVATLGLLRLMRSFAVRENGHSSDWLLFAVGAELTLWSHALGLLYAGCLALALLPAWLGSGPTKQRLIRGATTAVLVALFYLPCLWLIAGRAHDWGSGWLAWKPEMLLTLFAIYGVPVEVLTIVSAVAALTLFLLAKRAITDGFRSKGWSGERALLLLWWGPPILTATISALYLPLFLPRTLTPTLVPCYLAVSMALARTQQPKERTALAVALVTTLFPASLAMSLRAPTERWDLVDAFLQQHVGPSDLVWLYPNDNALPLRAVGPNSTYPRRGVPVEYPAIGVRGLVRAGSPAVLSLSREDAARYAARPEFRTVPTIWLVESEPIFSDPDGVMPSALMRIRRPGPAQRWGYIIVRPYSLR